MNDIVEVLDFWPLNAQWYLPVMVVVLVLLVLLIWLLGFLRRRAERQPVTQSISTAEIRQLRGSDG